MIRIGSLGCASCAHTGPANAFGMCPCGCRDHQVSTPPPAASQQRPTSPRWGGVDHVRWTVGTVSAFLLLATLLAIGAGRPFTGTEWAIVVAAAAALTWALR